MNSAQHGKIAGFIWNIADEALRDVYKRGKYRDVILPMAVLRRLDAVLEEGKPAVLEMKEKLDKAGVAEQDMPLRNAARHAFYNISGFTMRGLKTRTRAQQLSADFKAYLEGFSPNVQDILNNFQFHNQIPKLSDADVLGTLIEKFTSPDINLSPYPVKNSDGSVKHPGLDNHGMGTIFEELVRRFNEESNEEAGEHWTPRDAVKLMANLIFLPIAGQIRSSTYLLYDGACGTGGMLTVAEDALQELARGHGKDIKTHLYGQEINDESYAICKADLLLKGEGDAADNIIGGSKHSTLSNDAFPSKEFDFMLSNPPYGKSWKGDLEQMGGKDGLNDPRFLVGHAGDPDYSLVARSSDGQMMFLANMLSKMKQRTKLGSRIAEVHNGSSLFTGDAGQGESNIRRWIIENDWLEAIVALPLNMFYNTGIATYIWVLGNRKPEHRKGKVQLIDATEWSQPLRKNLGKKNCELGEEDIKRICDTFIAFEETAQSRIFDNETFGYRKITVERPLRIEGADPNRAYKPKEIKGLKENGKRSEDAPPVIRKIHKKGTASDPLRGLFEATINGKPAVVEYEPDTDLRDTEQVPLQEEGGIEAFLEREVLPHAPDAWYVENSVKIGYEISFTRYFYKPSPLRPLEAIRAEILALEKEAERLLTEQAVIHRALTRGLDPDVPLKDSGVEWLGKVPAHWDVRRGKWLFRHRKQINAGGEWTNVLSLTLRGVVNNDPKNPEGLVPKDYATYQLFRKGDLVFKLIDLENLQTSRVGLVHEDGIMSPAYVRLTPKVNLDIRFFYRQYFDLYLRGIYNQLGAGVRSTLSPNDLLELRVLLPPLPEQAAIVEHLDGITANIDAIIARTRREITLLQEYYTRLTADVVTGKVDVREIELPEKAKTTDSDNSREQFKNNCSGPCSTGW